MGAENIKRIFGDNMVEGKKYGLGYLVEGDLEREDGRVVVCLHGLGGCAGAWGEVATRLVKAGYSCLMIDLPGHGKSERFEQMGEYEFDRAAERVIDLITSLGIGRFYLVGHCYGGMTAMVVAGKGEVKLGGLIIVNSNPHPGKWLRRLGLASLVKSGWVELGKLLPSAYADERANHHNYCRSHDWSLRRIGSDIRHTSLKSYCWSVAQLWEFEGRKYLEKLRVPVLVVAGKKDRIVGYHNAIIIGNWLRAVEVKLVDEGNHIMITSKPEKLATLMIEWFENNEGEIDLGKGLII